ncbi:MAG: N-acetyltransferase [Nannocystaceae bacterium]
MSERTAKDPAGGGATPTIRPERPGDAEAIREVVTAAFPTPAEAGLVDALRRAGRLAASLVAIDRGGVIVGHVALSPVTVDGRAAPALGLAPVAVAPAHQGRGIGGALVRAAVAAARERGAALCVLLGAPGYYGRLGFGPAEALGLTSEYDAGDAFQALVLDPERAPGLRGLVRYAPEFADLE